MNAENKRRKMSETINLSLRCRYPRELPEGRFSPKWRRIPAMINSRSDRTPFLFLAELFELVNGPSARMVKFEARSDYMGGLEARLELAGDIARLSFDYEQRIDDEWQHVDRNVFTPSFETEGPVGMTFDIDLSGSGEAGFTLLNAEPGLVEKAMRLADECFDEIVLGPGLADQLRIKSLIAQAAWEKRRPGEEQARRDGGAQTGSGVERLVAALDRERDAYMEWHDGPDHTAEAEAVSALAEEELAQAGEMIAARLSIGYDVHLGRAAVLLGKRGRELPRMVTALEATLRREKRGYLRAHLARDILQLYSSVPAQMALRQAITEGAGWSEKADAICCLKELLEGRSSERPMRELLPPETAGTLLSALSDDDYLVRYHAADTLLKAAGQAGGVFSDKEIFGLICGSNREGKASPGPDDRRGFEKAADVIRTMLAGRRIV